MKIQEVHPINSKQIEASLYSKINMTPFAFVELYQHKVLLLCESEWCVHLAMDWRPLQGACPAFKDENIQDSKSFYCQFS